MLRLLTIAIIATGLLAVACADDDEAGVGDSGDETPATASVEIFAEDFEFSPAVLRAPSGASVEIVLINEGAAQHSFTIDEILFETEAAPGGSAISVMTVPDNEVEFYCKYHPSQMRGTITPAGAASDQDADTSGAGGYGY